MSWIAVGISVATTVIGAGVSIYGQQQQANAQQNAAEYNAKVQRQEADQTTRIAAENMRRQQRENQRMLSRLRAANAANGLAMEGTPLAVLGETQSDLELAILDIGYESQSRSRQLIAGAEMSLWEGKQQAAASRINQYATGIKGVSSATSGYLSSTGTI